MIRMHSFQAPSSALIKCVVGFEIPERRKIILDCIIFLARRELPGKASATTGSG